jgi:uncharacterized protein involved in type VI secretion and phage assembly
MSATQFLGKYRGVVSDNKDPEQLGRIRASVPDVFEKNDSGWALPCLPSAGSGCGIFTVPPVGSMVWIEFEHGDPDYPIWSGGWWGDKNDVPQGAYPDPDGKIILQTKGGQSLLLDDSQGKEGLTLTTSNGLKITIVSNKIEIDDGNGATIELNGSKVTINGGALEVS